MANAPEIPQVRRTDDRPASRRRGWHSVVVCLSISLATVPDLLPEQSTASPISLDLPHFSDLVSGADIDFVHDPGKTSQKHLIETMTGGVALFDYDGDGLLDIFFVNGADLKDPMGPGDQPEKSHPRYWNRLYRNLGRGKFLDVTEEAGLQGSGYGMGAATGDYDNDGHPDLYVTNFGRNILYRNLGDGTFTDVTHLAGVEAGSWSSSAAFMDYDGDGFLDLFVVRYLKWDFAMDIWCGNLTGQRRYCHPDNFESITHLVYRNQGDGTFRDVTAETGWAEAPGKGLGIAFNDLDGDGWLDVVVANDTFPQQLFWNRGNGTFSEDALLRGLAYDQDGRLYAGMGLDVQDFDNDGSPDVFINALSGQKYALYRNEPDRFEYVSGPSGVSGITFPWSGWGTRFLDYDNDGWKDLFVAQGHVMDDIHLVQPAFRYLQPFLMMRNLKGKFQDVSAGSGPAFLVDHAARGAAFGDLDNDGDIDIVVNCNNQRPAVLFNAGTRRHWLLVDTRGRASNRDGMGARIRLVDEFGSEQWGIVTTAGSYLSASDKRVHFGLGDSKTARLVEILWPSGVVQRLHNVGADQILTVHEPEQKLPAHSSAQP